jgi:hypothetical protein
MNSTPGFASVPRYFGRTGKATGSSARPPHIPSPMSIDSRPTTLEAGEQPKFVDGDEKPESLNAPGPEEKAYETPAAAHADPQDFPDGAETD